MLSKIIIFVMKDNIGIPLAIAVVVVNCFQKLLSSWWRTTMNFVQSNPRRLWIAFKNYYLRDEGQPVLFKADQRSSCELLSKIIIFVMKDNVAEIGLAANPVVNCFQKLLSSWWRTTGRILKAGSGKLWIAFKNYYLRDEGQQITDVQSIEMRCELLSKIIIFVMKDNIYCELFLSILVVNCFQKLLSSWWRTTNVKL